MVATLLQWTDAERDAWRAPEIVAPSVWAAANRVLDASKVDRGGPWDNDYTPYLMGLMDIGSLGELVRWPAARRVEELVIIKPAQWGGSEAIRNRLLAMAESDPGPCIYVMPDEDATRRIFAEELLPAFRECRALADLWSKDRGDETKQYIRLLNGYSLLGAWSGSPARLASKPCALAALDEADKYAEFSGREADPISLARARLKTFIGRRMLIVFSTPTDDSGLVSRSADACAIKLVWVVPCPHCDAVQALEFENLKWARPHDEDPGAHLPAIEFAEWLRARRGSAWFECAFCKERIDEKHKQELARRGAWALPTLQGRRREALHVSPAQICYDDWPDGLSVAIQGDPFCCPWTRWNDVAAQFVRADGDPVKLIDVFNNILGRVFRHRVSESTGNRLAERMNGAPPAGVVPNWARKLIATVDVQADHFYYVVRAWGYMYKSQLVAHGKLATWTDVERTLISGAYPMEDAGRPRMRIELVGIDAGYKPYEVYAFALRYPAQVKALKGEDNKRSAVVRMSRVTYAPPGGQRHVQLEVWLNLYWSDRYNDVLDGRMSQTRETADGTLENVWMLNNGVDGEYLQHMANEHKVMMRKNKRMVLGWAKVAAGARVDFRDCEKMQMVMADIGRVELLPPPPPPTANRKDAQPESVPAESFIHINKEKPWIRRR